MDDDDFEGRRRRLVEQMLKYRPRYLYFNGKKTAKYYFGKQRVGYGLPEQVIEDSRNYVAPSTHGTATRWWDIRYWFDLTSLVS